MRPLALPALALLVAFPIAADAAPGSYAYLDDTNVDSSTRLSNENFPKIVLTEVLGGLGAGPERLSKYDVIGPKAFGIRDVERIQEIDPEIRYHFMISARAYQGYLGRARKVCEPTIGIPFNYTGPASQGCTMWAGHWLYYAGTTTTSAISASATAIPVADASKISAGQYIVIYDAPAGSFRNAEHAKVTGVNRTSSPNRITVERRGYKSVAKAHPRGAIVAQHDTGNAGHAENWGYNMTLSSPRDANGNTMGEYMAKWLYSHLNENNGILLRGNGARIDGIYFDVDNHWSYSSGRHRWDTNNDLVADGGVGANGKNFWGEGLDRFYSLLRDRFPDKYIVGGARRSRGFGALNGIQAEGWPVTNNYRSPNVNYVGREGFDSMLQRMTVHLRHRDPYVPYVEALSKAATKLYPHGHRNVTSNAAFRFSFASSLLEDAYYGQENSSHHLDPWWDEYSVDVDPDSRTFGHAIRSNPADETLVRAHKGWLGRPLEHRRRVYDADQFRAGKSLINNGGAEQSTAGWSGANVSVVRDTSRSVEGAASLRVSGHRTYDPDSKSTYVRGPEFNVTKGKEYTFTFAARASEMRDLIVDVGGAPGQFLVPNEWTRIVQTFTAERSGTFRPVFYVGRESTLMWLDAVYLFEGNANVFVREFENGVVVVNATPHAEVVDLGETFRRIQGTGQDPINNGNRVTSVWLPAFDAAILVRETPLRAPDDSGSIPPPPDQSPSVPDSPGDSGFACGAPSFKNDSTASVYVWKACSGNKWSVRVVSTERVDRFAGQVHTANVLGSVTRVALEKDDVVAKDLPEKIQFDLRVWVPGNTEGFDFEMPSSGWGCLRIDSPGDQEILVGRTAESVRGGPVN
ncbi:MAG: carbohydrate binding domain-containing protein, partial [Thiohalocapsa sp.]|nr:carbohydrate binding domain-containing protein [Thiohalocapsa sp.]